jgi:RNA polymerase sigma-70 factor (ECF subfamily)
VNATPRVVPNRMTDQPPPGDVTALLLAWSRGDEGALAQLTALVHEELRRIARRYMSGERPGHPLQTTALVNEAYLKLVDARRVRWQNRAHFLGVAARLMRRILVDVARSRKYQKRGGAWQQVTLHEWALVSTGPAADLEALDQALERLARIDARKARVVELRFFAGLSLEESAEVLGVSTDTIGRDWSTAKTWLRRELTRS